MAQLENLLNLQKNHDLMDKLNMQLLQLKGGKQIKNDEAKYEKVLIKLTQMEDSLNSGKAKLRQSDYTLKEYELKLKEIDEELYSGSITNEKQLNHLTDERNRIKDLLEELETEILENMDIISSLEDEINTIKDKISEFKNQIELRKKQVEDNIKKLEKSKTQLNDNILKIISTIDDDLIVTYNKIRENKGSAIAEVQGGICSGCHIMVPSYQVEDIKRNKIIHCESCNRILHVPKVTIEK